MTHPSLELRTTRAGIAAIKTVSQTVSGTAYMKIPGLLMDIYQQGHNDITLRINREHPYLNKVQYQIQFLQRTIPLLTMEVY